MDCKGLSEVFLPFEGVARDRFCLQVYKGLSGYTCHIGGYRWITLLIDMGGHAGTVEKCSDWLGSSTGPHTKGCMDEFMARLCNKALISYG
jgi:hypothetical protein